MSLRPLKIVIPGGTGQLGRILARHFHEQGHRVSVIARHVTQAEWPVVPWNGFELGDWASEIDGADVVINLAGRSVNCRYTPAHQREIRHSRTITTGLVGQAIARAAKPPRLWLNASTATIYRHSLDGAMDDVTGEIGGHEPDAPSRWRFSVEVAQAWEAALFAPELPHTRRIAMRTGMVMSPDPGGAFDTFLRLVRWGLGGRMASGWQYISWIHDVDLTRAVEFLIEHEELAGPVNVTSPSPLTNRRFMSCLRAAWCTSYFAIPTPAWALPIGALLLRTETELVLKSRYVKPRRLCEAGFDFHFPNWRGACQDLVARWRALNSIE
ncbi:MAG TPA: TIGR01777 family oxidoreductase [Bryobacteraceae bacterium]|nr:TIGR01777 family oxidoreductase [Bryobacteraceae bacterium]